MLSSCHRKNDAHHSLFINIGGLSNCGVPACLTIGCLLRGQLPVLCGVPKRHQVFRHEVRPSEVSDHSIGHTNTHVTQERKDPSGQQNKCFLTCLNFMNLHYLLRCDSQQQIIEFRNDILTLKQEQESRLCSKGTWPFRGQQNSSGLLVLRRFCLMGFPDFGHRSYSQVLPMQTFDSFTFL